MCSLRVVDQSTSRLRASYKQEISISNVNTSLFLLRIFTTRCRFYFVRIQYQIPLLNKFLRVRIRRTGYCEWMQSGPLDIEGKPLEVGMNCGCFTFCCRMVDTFENNFTRNYSNTLRNDSCFRNTLKTFPENDLWIHDDFKTNTGQTKSNGIRLGESRLIRLDKVV